MIDGLFGDWEELFGRTDDCEFVVVVMTNRNDGDGDGDEKEKSNVREGLL